MKPFISFLEKRNEAKKFKRWNKNPISRHSLGLHRKLADGKGKQASKPSASNMRLFAPNRVSMRLTDFY